MKTVTIQFPDRPPITTLNLFLLLPSLKVKNLVIPNTNITTIRCPKNHNKSKEKILVHLRRNTVLFFDILDKRITKRRSRWVHYPLSSYYSVLSWEFPAILQTVSLIASSKTETKFSYLLTRCVQSKNRKKIIHAPVSCKEINSTNNHRSYRLVYFELLKIPDLERLKRQIELPIHVSIIWLISTCSNCIFHNKLKKQATVRLFDKP